MKKKSKKEKKLKRKVRKTDFESEYSKDINDFDNEIKQIYDNRLI